MSLYFAERIEEHKEDPVIDHIIFTYPWIISIPPQNEGINFNEALMTFYRLETEIWSLELTSIGVRICSYNSVDNAPFRAWNGSSCFISYSLYYDDDMRFLLHSSLRIKMTESETEDSFQTPPGFVAKLIEAFEKRKLSKIVIYVELHLPLKWFYRPFENPSYIISKKACDEYPEDMENNFKFLFLKISDYSIKCLDGSVPALKMVLNISSNFMKSHLSVSTENEFIVPHSIDAVKPIIYYLHTMCFEMPKSYNLEFVRQLYEVIYLFQPVQLLPIRNALHQSLCRKFVEENVTSFDLLLSWLSLACHCSFYALASMISSIIANRYYFKWHDTFPENARNTDNPIFRDVFGSQANVQNEMCSWIFTKIELTLMGSFQTNAILP